MVRDKIIMCDTNNHREKHPEIGRLEAFGFKTESVGLPIGDYCFKTDEMIELENNLRHEAYTQQKYHNNPEYVQKSMKKLNLVGTYNCVVDTKAGVDELYSNLLAGGAGKRYRFERELMLAKNIGVTVWVLIIDDEYESVETLKKYKTRNGFECGDKMIEKIREYESKYPCHFLFTDNWHAADTIYTILYLSDESDKLPYIDTVPNENGVRVVSREKDFEECYSETETKFGREEMDKWYIPALEKEIRECEKMSDTSLILCYWEMHGGPGKTFPSRKNMTDLVSKILALYDAQRQLQYLYCPFKEDL